MNSLFKSIQSQLKPLIKQGPSPTAAFDADGTLWNLDVGRSFFQYQIQNGLLKHSGPQKHFNQIQKMKGKKYALQWLALIQRGTSLSLMNKWVKDFLKSHFIKPFLFQKQLINWLLKSQVEVFIVSSSLKWILDQAICKYYPIKKSNIIGVETKVVNGYLTDQLIHPSPIQEDKVLALKKRTLNPPLLVSGNTLSDQALLEFSKSIRLVVTSAKKLEKNYLSEQALLKIAQKNKWLYLEPTNSSNSSTSLGDLSLNT